MTAHIDFASLPDAEAARLMAEKDGLSPRPYTTSLDAAVGWLAPAMEWCTAIDKPHGYFASMKFVPQMGGGWFCIADAFIADSLGRREHDAFGKSMTAALLHACLAARVPEIVRAMEGER